VPRFALDIVLGKGLARSLVLTSQRVVPTRVLEAEYRFLHPDLDGALEDLFG
jgi:uncharacterized protein